MELGRYLAESETDSESESECDKIKSEIESEKSESESINHKVRTNDTLIGPGSVNHMCIIEHPTAIIEYFYTVERIASHPDIQLSAMEQFNSISYPTASSQQQSSRAE
jgi:hypothetical protein